jgi:hypothetical protein
LRLFEKPGVRHGSRLKIVSVTFDDLTEPERLLWEAFPRGAWVDLRAGVIRGNDPGDVANWGQERIIRAEVIRALLLGAGKEEPGQAPGARLRGVLVKGRLDLMGATIAMPLVCEYCHFDTELRLVEASAKTVAIVNSHLPGFDGTRMRLDGILDFSASVISGMLRLDQARISGQLCLRDAVIGDPASGPEAIAANGLAVEGPVEWARLAAHGSVTAPVATITGSVDLTGAQITGPRRRALVMDYATIGGKLECRGLRVDGETRIHNCHVAASIGMSDAKLENPGGVALNAGGLAAEGGVFLTDQFAATGEVRLVGAQLGANLTLSRATFRNPGNVAVNLDRARIGACLGVNISCQGQISLVGAEVTSDLNLTGAVLDSGDDQPALLLERASIGGALLLTRLHAAGELDMRTVRVGQRLLLNEAQLHARGRTACRLSKARVAADLFCDYSTASGSIRLAGAVIGGAITLKQVQLANPAGKALDAPGIQARELVLLPAAPIQGTVDLSHAVIGVLRDDPGSWPDQLNLEAFTYQALDPALPARQRLRWLARDPRGHQPQPYEQLAAHYNTIGQPAQARVVLYTREQIQSHAKAPLPKTWSVLQDLAVGYGYQPWRALTWLALLLTAGTTIFTLAPPPALQPGNTPHFNAFIYTLDLLLPVVNLGQKYAYNPAGAEQWLSYLLIAAGWALVTTLAAGAARVLRRG